MTGQHSAPAHRGVPAGGAVGLVYDCLRRKIVDGELPPAVWLRQEEIAAELGVSRMPIREALRQLEAEGYVVCHTHRGWAVTALSAEDIEEIYLMRTALEGLAARLAAARLTDGDLARLEAMLDRMEELRDADRAEYLRADFAFHDVLYAAAGRQGLHRRIHLLQQNAARYLRFYIALPAATDTAIRGHRRILDACRRRDPELVELRAREHIAEIAHRVIEQIKAIQTGRSGDFATVRSGS